MTRIPVLPTNQYWFESHILKLIKTSVAQFQQTIWDIYHMELDYKPHWKMVENISEI